MKCQILFSGKNKKNIINLLSAENAQRVVKVNDSYLVCICFILLDSQCYRKGPGCSKLTMSLVNVSLKL